MLIEICGTDMVYSALTDVFYPVERCLDFPRIANHMRMVRESEPTLKACLVSACFMNDYHAERSAPSALTTRHLGDLLLHINSEISNLNDGNIEFVVFSIIALANAAVLFGDHHAARTHLRGLEKVVGTGGGRKYLLQYPKFHFKINRQVSPLFPFGKKKPSFTANRL